MNVQRSWSRSRTATVAGLAAGAVGIAILWAAGVEFPTYPPPGIVILLAGAGSALRPRGGSCATHR
jgi:hypothetical protein